ncbi:hypothetical protein SAMD00019534_103080, partial [Acytostelium subglobosum LB1]|uniref:hypothetical protein n=1 Tax=Acytostelium subglobosum LB1 TaxID=1410327 RepID=UPI000644C355
RKKKKMTTSLLTTGLFKSRVSSVLNKNSKEYGKDNMFDDKDDTCWNSHQGTPQSCSIQFLDSSDNTKESSVNITALSICFQEDCEVHAMMGDSQEFTLVSKFYPEDINIVQVFPLDIKMARQIKIVFKESTDFFGRITIYKMDVIG